jgi:hypothetical protein
MKIYRNHLSMTYCVGFVHWTLHLSCLQIILLQAHVNINGKQVLD